MRSRFILSILLLISLLLSGVMQAQNYDEPSVIPGQYIVVYKKDMPALERQMEGKTFEIRQQMMREVVSSTLTKSGLQNKEVLQVYETVFNGFALKGLSEAEAEKLLQDEDIAFVEPDQLVYLSVEQNKDSNPQVHEEGDSDSSILLSESLNNTKDPVTECLSLEINGSPVVTGGSGFGPYSFNLTGELILVDDNVSPDEDGCEAITNDLTGKIALIQRGLCQFSIKVYNAQQAGAIGVIVYNNVSGYPPTLGAGDLADLVTIPSMSISDVDGQAVIEALALGTVTATMSHLENILTEQCTPWGITRVGGGLSGAGKRAWIIDTGIDMDHPDLNVNVALSHSVIVGEPSPDDLNGHGTHVAGTVAAIDNGIGVIGVAAGAEVVAVKVFPNGQSSTPNSNVLAGMNYVAANAAPGDAVNYSIGGGTNILTDMAALGVAAVCPIVISAGNSSVHASNSSPQRVQAPNVYVISAMDPYDNFASFSNFGNPPVNYCAPGVNVVSTLKNGTYGFYQGTSMAAPHVTGLLLLGDICATTTVNNDPDGTPDPIAEHSAINASPTSGGTIADDQVVCYGDAPESFTNVVSPSGHTGTLEYQWQISTSSPTFVDISGAVSDTYTHIGTITQTTWFRRLARTTECLNLWSNAVSSNVVQVDVDPLPIAIISLDADNPLCSNTDIIDNIENELLRDMLDAHGQGIGFVLWGDLWNGTSVEIERTLVPDTDPLAQPGQVGDTYVLQFDATVNSYGGFTHAFENAAQNTWITKNWSSYTGISFWLYGQNTSNELFFDIQDNRNPGSTGADMEVFTYTFMDDFSGWQMFVLSFNEFTRKDIGNGAPDDGFNLNEVHGWAFGSLNTGGSNVTYYLDNVMVYGNTDMVTICENGSYKICGATAENGTILWTHDGTGTLTDETTPTPTYQASSTDGGNEVVLTMTVTSDNVCGTATATASFTIAVESASLTGVVSYYRYNAPNTPLPGVVVKLLDASGDVIGTSTTTVDGEYEFTDLTALQNTVALEVSSEMPHGGMSAIGSLAIQRSALSLPVIYWSPAYFLNHVGNVHRGIEPENPETGPPLNVIDAAFAQQRNMNPAFYFDAGEWAFHSPEDEVIFGNSDINTATRTFTFDGCTQTLDIEARTFGDVRGIYVVQSLPGKSSSTLQTEPTIVVAPGEEFSLPVMVKNDLQLSAMNLDLWFDADKVEVLAVESTLPGLQFTIESESIRIVWTSLNPLSIQKDQALVSLRLKTLTEVNENDAVFMQNTSTEFGDAMAMAIPGVEIAMNKISNSITGIAGNAKAMQHSFGPNPFTDQAVLQYTLPESGKVSIRILNQFGATVMLAKEAYLQAGSHQIIIDDSDLVSGGAYYYQILLESSTKSYQVNGKMVLIK
jgi:hypothetical protein